MQNEYGTSDQPLTKLSANARKLHCHLLSRFSTIFDKTLHKRI